MEIVIMMQWGWNNDTKNSTFRIYVVAILKTCHPHNFNFIIIGFIDPDKMVSRYQISVSKWLRNKDIAQNTI